MIIASPLPPRSDARSTPLSVLAFSVVFCPVRDFGFGTHGPVAVALWPAAAGKSRQTLAQDGRKRILAEPFGSGGRHYRLAVARKVVRLGRDPGSGGDYCRRSSERLC